MKLFVKLMLALLVIACLLPFTVLKNKDGRTLASFSDLSLPDLSLPDFSLPDMPDLSASKDLLPAQGGSAGMSTFYKWYDPQGNVQFTTEPPPDGVDYTVKEFDPNANLLQAVEIPVEEEPQPLAEPQQQPSAEPDSPYDKESISKLFEDAKNVQKLLNQRNQSQNDNIN